MREGEREREREREGVREEERERGRERERSSTAETLPTMPRGSPVFCLLLTVYLLSDLCLSSMFELVSKMDIRSCALRTRGCAFEAAAAALPACCLGACAGARVRVRGEGGAAHAGLERSLD